MSGARVRLWARVGGRWFAWFGTREYVAGVLGSLARLGGPDAVQRWTLDTAPTWPVGVAPRAGLGDYGGNDDGIRAAVRGWPDVCATCRETIGGRTVWTGHGPECVGCASRYAD